MLSKIPLWVFAILLALLWLGQRQRSTRVVAPIALGLMSLGLLGLSLYGVLAAFGAQPAALAAWALGLAAALTLGRRAVAPSGLARVGQRVRVPGSGWPMGLMMGIFSAKFVLGFATAVGSPVVSQPGFVMAASAWFGLLSGGLAARALAVQRFASRPAC